jgi:hypothetical protein
MYRMYVMYHHITYSVWKVSESPFQGEILYWYVETFLFAVLSPVIIVYHDEGKLFIIKLNNIVISLQKFLKYHDPNKN